MIEGWSIVAIALGYVGVLFAVAWAGDRWFGARRDGRGRPLIYALSLAVYCTSWTFFGSVGLAATTGYDFMPIYIGPILLFSFGAPLIARIVRVAKAQNITSVADFLAARYGKNAAVGAIVTVVAVAGSLPYIALQLKAVALSVDVLLGPHTLPGLPAPIDTALIVALAMAMFAVLFGTRHIDATEHQDGLMLAVAAESVVKLAAFLAVGAFATFWVLGGPGATLTRVAESAELRGLFARAPQTQAWITTIGLSLLAILMLPRQFHVAVVENHSEREIRWAAWLFPLYLLAINIFVVPIAIAGLAGLPKGSIDADMFVLGVPLAQGSQTFSLLAFIGGLSAATAMAIVESVALAIMVCNSLVVPMVLSRRTGASGFDQAMAGWLLTIRRVAIFCIILLGYLFFRVLGQTRGLVSIGLDSFAAIAQLAPAFFGGLIWRKATARGAIVGIGAGFAVWAYTLLWPWFVQAGFGPADILANGPFGVAALRPQALFNLQIGSPLTHGVVWSLLVNVVCYVAVSKLRAPEPVERLQAHIFVDDRPAPPVTTPSFRMWRTAVAVSDLQSTVGRYIGHERAERSFAEFAAGRPGPRIANAEADIQLLRFAEHLLASAIGAASSRLVLSLLLRRGSMSGASTLQLLDDASEALQYNRDLLQSALDQVRHGLSVFDKDMRLICWNRQYRDLLGLPAELGRVGVPLSHVLGLMAARGDFGPGRTDVQVADRLVRLADTKEAFLEHLANGRILEVRTSAMPQGGIVTTYSDITERIADAEALARANETLERRVAERTSELTEVNAALARAKAVADAANQDKTRFLAAASHDVLQPLNAARLYATALAERQGHGPDATLARNVDSALDAVEEIFNALIDIARLDSGSMEPEFSVFAIGPMLEQLVMEFTPLAREKGLELRVVPTTLAVRSDRRLLRRLLQNLISNAIKYTERGGVVVGARRRGGGVLLQVCDSGIGIAPANQALVFKEFHRLPETAGTTRGLGLGLSIVERIGRILDHAILVESVPGRGSTFSLGLPRAIAPAAMPAAQAPPAPAVRIADLVVLCVDNEPAVLDGMDALLSGWGCRVLKAAGVAEAVVLATGGDGTPSVVLADYHLGDGNGLDAIRAIGEALGLALPAIVITADHSAEVVREVRQSGALLLRKPLRAAALRALLSQLALQRAAAE